jgi:SEC-C motif-containing protein
MHPSLTADFTMPQPLRPQREMRVNETCWCGSGKKWKKCHRDRENKNPIPIWQLCDDQRAEMSRGYCLHPQARSETCSSKIIRAHTVQRKGGLATIAEGGHIISPKRGVDDIFQNEGKIVPRLHGINDATTFMGFCAFHDDQLFSPIEKAPLTLSREAAFLLSFRAICYECLSKDAALRSTEILRQMDKGKPFELQSILQQLVHFYKEGLRQGIKDLNHWKGTYDSAYLNGKYDEFSFYGVMFSISLPLVASGAFHPEFDFEGNRLQIITRGESGFEHVSLNLTNIGGKSVAIFGSTGESNGPAACFLESFRKLSKTNMANAAFHVACEQLENICFRPSWWNGQTFEAKEHLIRRFRSGIGLVGIEREPDCLSKLTYTFATAEVEQEASS